MLGLLSRVLAFFWRRAEGDEGGDVRRAGADAGHKEVKTVQGVVTRFCHDYGMINDLIIFTKDAVSNGMPLAVGQEVTAIVEEDKISSGLKAIRVDAVQTTWGSYSTACNASEQHAKILIGNITSLCKDGGYINQTTHFTMEDVCEGFKPYVGDLVQAQYFIKPTTWSSEAVAVKPLRYKRVDKKVEASVLTKGVKPVAAELRNTARQSHSNPFDLDDPYENLMRNKGGLEVSRTTDFGTLKQGESRSVVVWIEVVGRPGNTTFSGGSRPCELEAAVFVLSDENSPQERNLSKTKENVSLVKDENLYNGEKEQKEDVEQAVNHTNITGEVVIPPGGKTSVVIICTAVNNRKLPSFLPHYTIPDELRRCVEQKLDVLTFQPLLAEGLNINNYKAKFSTLLWLEEIYAEMEIKDFSMSGITLKRNGNLLVLEVPGLEEGRPHLNTGDKVILKSQVYSEHIIEYVAYITEIRNEDVTLKFNADFEQAYNSEPMDVEFVHCRITSRRCQLAVEQATSLGEKERLLLRSPQAVKTQNITEYSGVDDGLEQYSQQESEVKKLQNRQTKCMASRQMNIPDVVTVAAQTSQLVDETVALKQRAGEFFNPALNEQQKLAVKRIVSGECRPTPYILFGPPGTGKTITVVEAILQIHYTLPDSRILVCAPSNAATDLICLRLHQSNLLKPGAMVRINASCRSPEQIDDIVKPYCKDGEDIWKASWFRIIITTCSSAGMFYQTGVRLGHFTHVILDEAGQACEPESLIPIGLISEANGQIVLVGDPKQLGPVIKSKIALAFGLNMSLLERLLSRDMYRRDEDAFSASGSYNPLLGNETREGHSPSWFNPTEAVQVMQYCCHLAKNESTAVSVTDIGVITPYRKQRMIWTGCVQFFFDVRVSVFVVMHVEKIRFLLRSIDLSDVKVGTVEEFQGQEHLVTILSTVRSHEGIFMEEKYYLGFLSNPKRFNVAITRAKALLIVVGNPHVLVKDPCFCALLEYSLMNKAYVGCDLPSELECLHQ
ncbi:RNA helicase Mov10l1 [Mergus octosetaceus]